MLLFVMVQDWGDGKTMVRASYPRDVYMWIARRDDYLELTQAVWESVARDEISVRDAQWICERILETKERKEFLTLNFKDGESSKAG